VLTADTGGAGQPRASRALALVAAAAVCAAAAGCGSKHTSADERNAHELAAGLGFTANVNCAGESCSIRATQPLHSAAETWLIALPGVTVADTDPSLQTIKTLRIDLLDRAGTRQVTFHCRLPHATPTTTRNSPRITRSGSVHQLCSASFRGLS
jgi:hypothetical protein